MALRLRDLFGRSPVFAGGGYGRATFKDFTEKERKRLADSGAAMPDGSFPIRNEADLKNAIQSIGRAKDPAAAKRHIIKRARALGKTDLLPEDWKTAAAREQFRATGAFSIALDGDEPPEWVEVVPAGTFSSIDGRGPFYNDRPEEVVAATRKLIAEHMKAGLPVDLDHSSVAGGGTHAPAVGWIREVEARNGAIFARVEWNAAGIEAIKSKQYKYLSPVFSFEPPAGAPEDAKTGRITLFENLALTNQPALTMPPVAASLDRRSPPAGTQSRTLETIMKFTLNAEELRQVMIAAKKGKPLHETVRDLQAALPNVHPHKILDMAKLAVDPETAMDAADGDPDNDGDNDGDEGAMSAENPYDGESDEQMATRRAGGGTSMARAQIDAAIAQHPMMLEAQRTIASLRGERAAEKAVTKVAAAIREGKLLPAQREWAEAYCQADPAGFATFIGAQPTYVSQGESLRVVPPGSASDPEALTETEKMICAMSGQAEADFLARKKKLAAALRGQEGAGTHKFVVERKAA